MDRKSLINDLHKALEILSEYSGEYASAEKFYCDLRDRVQKLEHGDDSVIAELQTWFTPTCQWDDFVGNISLGEHIFQKINGLKKAGSFNRWVP